MTNKPTDNEIIKAFEHCLNTERGYKCRKCEYVTGCKTWLMREALDLLTRQKAENEAVRKDIVKAEEYAWKLKSKNEALQMDNEQLKSDIINERMNLEHIQAENERLQMGEYRHIGKTVKNARREGIEDVLDRLRNIISLHTENHISLGLKDIDLIESEMVGDTE